MKHVILLGDSIFDNAVYTAGGPAVIDQVNQALGSSGRATLLAVDGSKTQDVPVQMRKFPLDATHLILSVGGNDALAQLDVLRAPVGSIIEALDALASMTADFRVNYANLINTALSNEV